MDKSRTSQNDVAASLGFDGIEVVAYELVHLEHVDLVHLEDGLHLLVAEDLSLVFRVLEVVPFDVFP